MRALGILLFLGLTTACREPIAVDTDPVRQQLIRIPFLLDRAAIDEKDRTEFQRELRDYLDFLEVQNDYGRLWRSRREFRGSQALGIDWDSRWKRLKAKTDTFSERLFDTGRRIQLGVALAAMEAQLWVFCIHEEDEESCREVERLAELSRFSYVELGIPERIDALLGSADLHPTTRQGLEDLRRETLVALAQDPSFPVRLGSFTSWPRKGDLGSDYLAYLRHLQNLYDGMGEDKNGQPLVTTVTIGYRDLDFEHLIPIETLVERTNQVRAIRNSLWWSATQVESKALRGLSLVLAKNILSSHHCQLRRATAARILSDPLWSKTLIPADEEGQATERDRQIFARNLIAGETDLTRLAERARHWGEKRPQLLAEIHRLSRLFGEIEFSTKFIDRALISAGRNELEVGVLARQKLSKLLESEIAEVTSPLSDDCGKK